MSFGPRFEGTVTSSDEEEGLGFGVGVSCTTTSDVLVIVFTGVTARCDMVSF